jgi:hypothetical protein
MVRRVAPKLSLTPVHLGACLPQTTRYIPSILSLRWSGSRQIWLAKAPLTAPEALKEFEAGGARGFAAGLGETPGACGLPLCLTFIQEVSAGVENVELNIPRLQFMPFLPVPADLTRSRLLYKQSGPHKAVAGLFQVW